MSSGGKPEKPALTLDSLCIVKFACHMVHKESNSVWSMTAVGRSNRGATSRAEENMASMITMSGSNAEAASTSSSPTAGELM
jgi:hypothetical protein